MKVPHGRSYGVAVLRFTDAHLDEYLDQAEGLLEHSADGSVRFGLSRFALGCVDDALCALCHAGAWVGSSKVFLHKPHATGGDSLAQQLGKLGDAGLASFRELAGSDYIQWQLELHVGELITTSIGLKAPTPFLKVREGCAITELTLWELVRSLEEEGWEWKRAPKVLTDRDALLPAMLSDDGGDDCEVSPKIWYSAGVTLSAAYLRCCIEAEQWLKSTRITMLRHCQDRSYYKGMEDGQTNGALPIIDKSRTRQSRHPRKSCAAAQGYDRFVFPFLQHSSGSLANCFRATVPICEPRVF